MLSFSGLMVRSCRLSASFAAVLGLALALLVFAQPQPAAADGGYPHADMQCSHAPYSATGTCLNYDWGPIRDNQAGYSVQTTYSGRGYGYRNCTDWVAWKLESMGVSTDLTRGRGNAGSWNNNLRGVTSTTTPEVGSVAVWESPGVGHVAFVEEVRPKAGGGWEARVSEYNQAGDGTYRDTRWVQAPSYVDFNGVNTSAAGRDGKITEGEFVKATDTGNLYVIAGGSPMYVSNLAAVNWTDRYEEVKQADIDRMPMYPRDGTVLKGHATGHLYVVAGGFAFYVTGLHKIPYSSWIEVDAGTIGSETRPLPADGTVVRDWESKSLYTIVGGAALWVQNPATIGYTGHTDIDGWGLTHQLLPRPANGSVFRVGNRVHVAAGGAPMQVNNLERIPPVSNPEPPFVDPYTVTHLMPQYPADGTVIRDYLHGSMYVVVGGWPSAIMHPQYLPYQGWVELDGWSIENQLRPFPMDGRFVVGKPSGRVFRIENQTAVYVGDMSQVTSTPIPINDWSVDNQLLN